LSLINLPIADCGDDPSLPPPPVFCA